MAIFIMVFLRALLLIFATLVVLPSLALAQENVRVRVGTHDGYARLVFEWPSKPDYSLSKENDRILLRFSRSTKVAIGDVGGNVLKIETLSKGTEPLQIAVTIPRDSKFRDFIVANKMILDVFDSKTAAPKPKEEAKIEPEPEKVPEKTAEKAPEKKAEEDFSVKSTEPQKTTPVEKVEAKPVPAPALPNAAITLTNTTSTGLAVFIREGWLWIINDSPELAGVPEIVGEGKDKFPPLEKVEIKDGAAYRMDLPEGASVSAQGGGLSWTIKLIGAAPLDKAAQPVVDGAGEGAKISWPMRDMRKTLTLDDPDIGDKITLVTALDASQYAGKSRQYVDFKTLHSIVGFAYLSKSGDVIAQKTLDKITLGRDGGLSVSLAKDTAAPNINQQINEKDKEEKSEQATAPVPENIAQAVKTKPTGNNVYNFPRWEMGGIAALNDNLHAMMTDVSTKKDEARNEDILTMAKLNMANNRAAEALGLMRVVLQKVPELGENADFMALRGAALALAGKYDEAFSDLSNENLKKYDDVKYWLAYTLAGLEDWKQAMDVMPNDISPIIAYPKAIRVPLILTFAEIALRGGDEALGAKILEMLKNDLPKLPIYQASSWNYLAGEAQRQAGQTQRAEEYWNPLVKNGKDDLFRAKAGLSLTKLQIDEKKLSATEAINRLEGLRYAWRGDELETLINFRLGQMYLDGKEYLKGLTVLRNAVGLSNNAAMTKEVTQYMTDQYRDIFAKDKLKNIAPLDAIRLYEEFKDLLPIGNEGNAGVEKLAERLVEADLLGRSASLLQDLVNNKLEGDHKAEIAIRLAAIRLLDGNPDGALRALEIAENTLDRLSGKIPAAAKPADEEKQKPKDGNFNDVKLEDLVTQAGDEKSVPPAPAPPEKADPEKYRQVSLLRARALSMLKKTDEAMAILEKMPLDPDVNRLRTDIAWIAGRWEAAAFALNDLIVAEDISPSRPLSDYQMDLILNRGIALNLSGDRVALANLRERYNAQMKDTPKGQMFEIVSRPRRPDMIGSREAIMSMMSEIDLFKGFLDGYAKVEKAKETPAKVEPKAAVPVKAETKK